MYIKNKTYEIQTKPQSKYYENALQVQSLKSGGVAGRLMGALGATAATLGASLIKGGRDGQNIIGKSTLSTAGQFSLAGGAIVPGWGHLIGAVVGSGVGLAQGAKKKKSSDQRRDLKTSQDFYKSLSDKNALAKSYRSSIVNNTLNTPRTPGVSILRRGGSVNLAKQNVIMKGPSHEDENNVGIEGEKGLPIVQGGVKTAEIESEEWVLNGEKYLELEKLTAKAKDDPEVLRLMGKILKHELLINTHDYSTIIDEAK